MDWDMQKVLVPIVDTVIIVIGLLGHSLVIFILVRRRRKTASRTFHGTDTLLLALSTSDMLLLLSLPFHTAAITLGNWPFGSLLCKAVSFLGVACNTVSVFTLAALAVTRYLTVVHPTWAYRSRMKRWLQVLAVLLWAPAMALAAPQFAFRNVGTYAATHCFAFLSDISQVVYSTALFLCSFVLPLLVIILMYAKLYSFLRRTSMRGHALQLQRYQKQVTQTTALLVVVFTVCWLPSYIVMFCRIGQSVTSTNRLRSLALLARLMATSSSMVNPLLYAFVSRKFRRELLGKARCADCTAVRGLVCCPERSRDIVQPFNPAELETPQP
ncbi:galanin receptor type 2-like [Ictalurus furcatus]|uniref:galanin receptor type 2-like n=1 Tax=Ictalurus furcatus TaxID=66913 RepID=UPI002350EB8B|nr:galanin receptor type 2-like [Ictalurus furcatus]